MNSSLFTRQQECFLTVVASHSCTATNNSAFTSARVQTYFRGKTSVFIKQYNQH